MKLTIKDIARAANVSPATVSNALNNRKGVSEDVRQLVYKVAKDIGYMREPAAKRNTLRFVVYKRYVEGYVVSDTPFFSSLIEGIEKQCRAQGFELLISHVNIHEADYNERINSIINDYSSGIILLATEMTEEDLEAFKAARVPIVLLDSHFRNCGYDTVSINNTDAAYRATTFLIDNGHTQIGYLRSSKPINNFRYRHQGYSEALTEHGLNADENHQIYLEPSMDGSYRDMKTVLEERKAPLPTAFFADNDIIAFGAMKALQEKGIRIPEDVSIVGFDDMPFCEMTNPRLTTIKVFKQEIGSIAVRRLIEKMDRNENPVQKIEVETELVIRDSHRNRLK